FHRSPLKTVHASPSGKVDALLDQALSHRLSSKEEYNAKKTGGFTRRLFLCCVFRLFFSFKKFFTSLALTIKNTYNTWMCNHVDFWSSEGCKVDIFYIYYEC